MAKYYSHNYKILDEDATNLRTDYGFWDYCIDVFELARCMGMVLIPYSSLSEEQQDFINEIPDLSDGFTVMHRGNNEWEFLTYFNDSLPAVRQRFTIAHEIKHVLYREENPTKKDEELANHFARFLLAPTFLVMLLMKNHSELELSEIFKMSFSATQNAIIAARARVIAKGENLEQYEIDYIDYMNSNKNKKC